MGIQIQSRASTQPSLGHLVRLACLRHAASVHPEPGSNSPKNILNLFQIICIFKMFVSRLIELTFCSVFKDHFRFFSKRNINISNAIDLVKQL